MLTALKDKLESLIEEKTWYTQSEWTQEILDKMIRLAVFLIDRLDGKLEKTKHKLKLDYEYRLIDEKAKEELRELLEKIAMYFEEQKEQSLKHTEYLETQSKVLKKLEESLENVQKMTNGWNTILNAFNQCKQKTGNTFAQLRNVPRHLLFLYSPFKQNHPCHYEHNMDIQVSRKKTTCGS